MVTSKDILNATGLRSAKTLTRWHKRGIIPKSDIVTHPSGRGKIAIWPDWVSRRCVRLVELQKEGHSLTSAQVQLGIEDTVATLESVKQQESYADKLRGIKLKLPNNIETNVMDLFKAITDRHLERAGLDLETRRRLTEALDEHADVALRMVDAGMAPVLVHDGAEGRVIPDFAAGFSLSYELPSPLVLLSVPLIPVLKQVFGMLSRDFPFKKTTHGVPKVRMQEGDVIVEYDVYPGGLIGYELIKDTAKVLGQVDDEDAPSVTEGRDDA